MPVITQSTALFNPYSPLTRVNPPGIDGVGTAYDADVAITANQPVSSTATGTGAAYDPVVTTNTLPAGMTSLVLDEQFTGTDLNASRWYKFNEAWGTGGSNPRQQFFRPQNIEVSAASSGGTGNSVKCISKRESYGGWPFTAGMFASKEIGVFYPIFGMYEARMKMPHGQGVWPAFWLRHRDGASVCEIDIMEYFHAEQPGKARMTLHRTNNAGTAQSNVNKVAPFFEAPTLTPAWHTFTVSILPESTNVRIKGWVDSPGGAGTPVWNYLDTQAVLWSNTKGTSHPSGNGGANIFDITVQGSQIGGTYLCHPDDPKGYSRWLPGCVVSGTAPNSCAATVGGYSVWTDAADYGGTLFPNTFELDYIKVWSAL